MGRARRVEEVKKKRGRPRVLGPTIAVDFRLPAGTWAEIKGMAEAKGESMGAVIRLALTEWLLAKKMKERD